MTGQKILLPYNFLIYDQKALDFVISTFAYSNDVEITIFNAYTPVPEIDIREAPIMEKLHGNLNYLSQKVKEQEAGLKAAKQKLLQNGFSTHQIHMIFKPRKKDIAGEIIDLALDQHFNVIVINRKPGKVTRFFTGSLFNKVVNALEGKVVCIVS